MKVELLVRFANEGHYYNNIKIDPERIENVLPFSITHLTFGYYFNKELKEGCIPNSVTHLTFNKKFKIPFFILFKRLNQLK